MEQREAGTPGLARDAADVLAMRDMIAWISVLGLLDECPILPAALTAVLIRRDFPIRRVKLVAGLDVFNVFNTVVFGGINTNITSTAFGRVSSQVNTPRVAQLKARLEF